MREMMKMNKVQTALIIDDDPDAITMLEYVLSQRFPELSVSARTDPDPAGEFDVYFVDNDFRGQCLAGTLASAIRRRRPNSLVVAFSARLDVATLKQLVNAGCDGACDKSDSADIERMLEIIDKYLKELALQNNAAKPEKGLFSAIRSITDLIREWNRRFEGGPLMTVPQAESSESAFN
jgi:DNA-binding NtrC family response regulator